MEKTKSRKVTRCIADEVSAELDAYQNSSTLIDEDLEGIGKKSAAQNMSLESSVFIQPEANTHETISIDESSNFVVSEMLLGSIAGGCGMLVILLLLFAACGDQRE